MSETYFTQRNTLDFPKALKDLEDYLRKELGATYEVYSTNIFPDKFYSVGVSRNNTDVAFVSLDGQAVTTEAEINNIEGLLLKWATDWQKKHGTKYHFNILVLKTDQKLRKPFTVNPNPAGP